MNAAFRRYLLPGFVFQSVVIAGGYGTGRELVEFFLSLGPRTGLLAMAVSTIVWSAVAMASFEFARVFGTYDYRSFFRELEGPGWILFEICYILILLVVLAVVAAAAGAIGRDVFALPYAVGVVAAMVGVGLVVFGGTPAVERFFAGWSVLLYGVYALFFVWCLARFGIAPGPVSGAEAGDGGEWVVAGLRYAGYNVALVPVILFVVRHAGRRRHSLIAGALTGPVGMLPGLLFYLAVMGQYPEIVDVEVPANHMLELLDARWFQVLFQVVLFGTLVETGAGLIHGVNERIAGAFAEAGRTLPDGLRSALAVVLLVLGTGLARFGLIDLIARGYGTLTWAFIVVFVAPVLTLGVWKLVRAERVPDAAPDDPGA